jgi:hypothetical protein
VILREDLVEGKGEGMEGRRFEQSKNEGEIEEGVGMVETGNDGGVLFSDHLILQTNKIRNSNLLK